MEGVRVKRRRRWPWVLLAILTLIGGSVLWYWRGTVDARHRLLARVEELRAAGEPMSPEELNTLAVPDEQNAAIELQQARQLLKTESAAWNALRDGSSEVSVPLTAQEMSQIQTVLEENAQVQRLIASAMKKTGVDWHIRLQSPCVNVVWPDMAHATGLSEYLNLATLAAKQSQDDRGAVECVQQMLCVSRAIERQPRILAHRVALVGLARASRLIEQISPELRIGSGPNQAEPRQVQAVIAQLLDEEPETAAMITAWRAARVFQLDSAMAMADGRLGSGSLAESVVLTRKWPLYADALTLLEQKTAQLGAYGGSPTWPECQRKLGLAKEPSFNPRWHPLLLLIGEAPGSASSVFEGAYRVRATRRLAAVALAARWYATDHDGKLPAKLEDLVPQYLPCVPRDPLAGGQAPLRYLPGPMIDYSVGEDGKDDGGIDPKDLLMHLSRQPRPQPATKPATRRGMRGGHD